ncbi:MAG: redoxin domain-containing protein [Anaerolineales bacterium]|jgi:cytochrome c biogenesis protein CcmG/thiol:disulfide interchange protein DsbE
METKLPRRWTLISMLILLAGAGWIWASKAPPDSALSARPPAARQGFSAPDFTLQTLDGETVRLSDLRGQPVLINLWASWCPPCKAEMPAFERVYGDYHDKGFQILAVNATNQDNLNNAIQFVQDYELSFPILLDTDGEVSRQYQLNSLPTSFFVDRNGIIQQVIVGGPMSEALLRIRVEQLLQEKP